jgi:hypothetical protein
MAIYEQSWFIKFITFMRKFKWFEKYVWGRSTSMQDFSRNPFEVLWETLAIPNVKPYSLILIRIGFLKFDPAIEGSWDFDSKVGKGFRFSIGKWKNYIGLFIPFLTKFPNNFFAFQIIVSMKGWIPIPCVTLVLRFTSKRYFQFGLGMAPDMVGGIWKALIYAKFRITNEDRERILNPSDSVGYYDGTC